MSKAFGHLKSLGSIKTKKLQNTLNKRNPGLALPGFLGNWLNHQPWRDLNDTWMWQVGTRVSGGFGSAGLMLGLADFGGVDDSVGKEVGRSNSAVP